MSEGKAAEPFRACQSSFSSRRCFWKGLQTLQGALGTANTARNGYSKLLFIVIEAKCLYLRLSR